VSLGSALPPMIQEGLITLEKVRVIAYRAGAASEES
jgi:hypothetical protein